MGPAETTDYMILGFAFIFVPMAIYIWSLVSRRKNALRDLALMKELDE